MASQLIMPTRSLANTIPIKTKIPVKKMIPDYQNILTQIEKEILAARPSGRVPDYIPGLAAVSPAKFGIHLLSVEGQEFSIGDSREKFSIQSITKALLLAMVLSVEKENPWDRVGVEASGDPFNSLIQLEREEGVPRNPFINSGALVICDILLSRYDDPKSDFLNFVRRLAGNPTINYDESVAKSEREVAYRNLAMLNLMRSFGNIENEPWDVINFYCSACAIAMNCQELSHTFSIFMNHGGLENGEEILTVQRAKRINAIMLTCGFYDEAGEFAFRVGLPGKSGVGGGIAAIYPGQYTVTTWSPPLNEKGNSSAGLLALELLTNMTGSSIF